MNCIVNIDRYQIQNTGTTFIPINQSFFLVENKHLYYYNKISDHCIYVCYLFTIVHCIWICYKQILRKKTR